MYIPSFEFLVVLEANIISWALFWRFFYVYELPYVKSTNVHTFYRHNSIKPQPISKTPLLFYLNPLDPFSILYTYF